MKYLYKCESFPVVWYFTFYRTPGDTRTESGPWRVVTVRFDTERFDTELELLAVRDQGSGVRMSGQTSSPKH